MKDGIILHWAYKILLRGIKDWNKVEDTCAYWLSIIKSTSLSKMIFVSSTIPGESNHTFL